MRLKWEEIEPNLYRTKIPGGWLVKQEENVYHNTPYGMSDGYDIRSSICFVPDEGHYWKVKINNIMSLYK